MEKGSRYNRAKISGLTKAVTFLAFVGIGALLAVLLSQDVSAERRTESDTGAAEDSRGAHPASLRERPGQLRTAVPKLVTKPENRSYHPAAYEAVNEHRNPLEVFNNEPRDPSWAPKMESTLRKRFDKELLDRIGISELEIKDLECRSSACRLELEWPEALKVQQPPGFTTRNKNPSPFRFLLYHTGPFAGQSAFLPSNEIPPPGKTGETVWLFFGEEGLDPQNYSDWVERHKGRPAAAITTVGKQ